MSNDPKKRVQAAAQRPENQHCADCGCKLLTSSVWASSTLGIFVCINCSGRHRNLGTHITFIRSLTLDSWTEEQAVVMENIGNEISNKYWEANLPKDYPRPATDDLDGLTKFIRFKYELGKWADKTATPPNVLLKQGKKPKAARAVIQQSASAAPIAAQQSQQVPKSNSASALIDFGSSSAPVASTDLLFGAPAPTQQFAPQFGAQPVFGQPQPHTAFAPQPQMQSQQMFPRSQGSFGSAGSFGSQGSQGQAFGMQQNAFMPQQSAFGMQQNAFGARPQNQFAQPQPQAQFTPFAQPQQPQMTPQQDARSALKSMLQSSPSVTPATQGTAVFRQQGMGFAPSPQFGQPGRPAPSQARNAFGF